MAINPNDVKKNANILTSADKRRLRETNRNYGRQDMWEWYERDVLNERSDNLYLNRFPEDGSYTFEVTIVTYNSSMQETGRRFLGKFLTKKDALICKRNYITKHLNEPKLRVINDVVITVKNPNKKEE